MSSVIGKEVDVVLTEYLARELGVEYLKARAAGRKHTKYEFEANYTRLKGIVGDDVAKEVVCNGDFLNYANGTLDGYLAQARIAAGKLGETAGKLPSVFHSTVSLENFLNPPVTQSSPLVLPDDFWRYSFLHDNTVSRGYLNRLIDAGEISATGKDRLSASGTKGPRGWMVIWTIRDEIDQLFRSCGLPKPQISIQHGKTGYLRIDAQTRQYLAQIRDAAYQIVQQ